MDPLGIFAEAVTGSLSTYSISRAMEKPEPVATDPSFENNQSQKNQDAVQVSISPEAKDLALRSEKSSANQAQDTNSAPEDSSSDSKAEKTLLVKGIEYENGNEDSRKEENEEEAPREEKANQNELRELKARDREVRSHEQAHLAAAGSYARGGAKFTYETGPDGKQYAVGGEVSIDVSPGGSPEETVRKAQVVRRAALAPAEPSSTDRQVAARAAQMESQARAELAKEQIEDTQSSDTIADSAELREENQVEQPPAKTDERNLIVDRNRLAQASSAYQAQIQGASSSKVANSEALTESSPSAPSSSVASAPAVLKAGSAGNARFMQEQAFYAVA